MRREQRQVKGIVEAGQERVCRSEDLVSLGGVGSVLQGHDERYLVSRLATALEPEQWLIDESCFNYPPSENQTVRFPSLCWPPHDCLIYTVYDSWRFTLTWTLILFTAFHLSATAIALLMQVGKSRSIWKYLVAVPVVYAVVAGTEALVAGSVTGSM
ncbi:hypothetical protein NUW58_g9567 [Xylaria curta]|uniref:Uncharacterized protein n=1 Tax=Xylaria curta TaxID=42375 RepID=A0ACC1MXB0_9PEZI|nr:hypothetical protein NUW58_g9567 [Xylaria curta]